jgi:hypothetical protein
MNEADRISLENIDLNEEQDIERLRKASLYWKNKHQDFAEQAIEAVEEEKRKGVRGMEDLKRVHDEEVKELRTRLNGIE